LGFSSTPSETLTGSKRAPPAQHANFRLEEIFRVTSDKTDRIAHISDTSFEEDVLKARRPVLIDFWAEWCGPCKAIAPMLSEIAEEYRDKVTIVKLNVDENPKTSQRFNVRSIPTLILFKNGQVEGQKVGAPRKSDLVAFLDSKL
jgi:thioredoxin 1